MSHPDCLDQKNHLSKYEKRFPLFEAGERWLNISDISTKGQIIYNELIKMGLKQLLIIITCTPPIPTG